MKQVLKLFDTRLQTLSCLLDQALAHFGGDEFLGLRLVEDMHPQATQVAFTCNQPRNFTQWVRGEELSNLDPDIRSAEAARQLVEATRAALSSIDPQAASLPAGKTMDFGPAGHAELSGEEYVNDFFDPHFYFHLVTTYAILRANGVQIGKADYMAHLLPRLLPQRGDP